jgi:citrate synthase
MPDLGLEINGTILGQTRLSAVDGPTGHLSYCGYDFHELAEHASWEEVLYLLWHDRLPSKRQLAELRDHMSRARCLDGDEMAFIRSLPTDGHGMDTLRTVISALPEVHPVSITNTETVFEEGMRIAAKLPTILTTLLHLRNGEQPVPPDAKLDHAANFLWMLNGIKPDDVAVRAMNTYMVVVAENGLNISTFVAAVIASTQNDLYAATTAALAALKGLAHGGANEHAMRAFLAMGTPDRVDDYLEGMISRKERLMGVGHRVFEVEDPRVRHMRAQSAALAARPGSTDRTHAVAERVAAVLQTHPYYSQRNLHPNVEFYSAPLLYQLGFPLDFFTAAFACGRIAGWVAHVHEQLMNKRLVRPESEYVGEGPRQFVPLDERAEGETWR